MTETPPGSMPLPEVPGLTDLSLFARGGYATVYRATQASVGREVAVKVENRTLDSERDQQRFLREARAAGRMSSHPHVVDLFDVGVTADRHPYLIMELCDGSYAERMRTSPLGPTEARDLGVKIADALAHSHASGVLHRDVKPANILYSGLNPAVLADFGLAVIGEARDPSVMLEVLTPAYAPPEMFRHSPPASSVDVYALCATLYAVMHGNPPRWPAERNPSLIALIELFNQPLPALPGVPDAFLDVLRHGMDNDPTQRPSAERLRDLLAAVPIGAPAAAHRVPVSVGVSTDPDPTPTVPPPSPPPRARPPAGPPERRPAWQIALGVLGAVLLLVTVGAVSWWVGRHPGTDPRSTSPTDRAVTGAPTTGAPTGGGPTAPATGGTAGPSGAAGTLAGCRDPLPGGGRCPVKLECFGPVRIRGSAAEAEVVTCAGRHTWESYATGDLPVAVDPGDHRSVVADPLVTRVCQASTFVTATGQPSAGGWRFEVLPPSRQAAESGDRTYRCLAGKGVDALAGPTLGR